MTDIVERLRTEASYWHPSHQKSPTRHLLEAADEIERLRSERSLTDITRELTLLNRILDRIAVALGAGSIKTP